MNYELFKEVVVEKFKDFMPEEFKNYNLSVRKVTKVNETLDAISLVPTAEAKYSVTPTIYINTLYEHYQNCENLQDVLQSVAETMTQAYKNAPQVSSVLNFENAKDNIVMALINTEQNKELLENVPNRKFLDLSIIYRWIVDTDIEGISSTIINNSLAERMDLTEEEIYKFAEQNTSHLFPPTVKSMNEVIRDIMVTDGMPTELAEMMTGEVPLENTLYVISNSKGIDGAVSIIYEENLHKLAKELQGNLYIMPSSRHEVFAVSASMGDPNELAQIVTEINMDHVSLDDRLSNQVYHYDKDLRKLSLATDTPNNRLDGIDVDPNLNYVS